MSAATLFDRRHAAMARQNATEGIRGFCYDQQAAWLVNQARRDGAWLDVGCGPALPYARPPGVWVIGLDPSAASLEANADLDGMIVGTAAAIPLPAHDVETVVAFYSVHHMTAASARETAILRHRAFSELARVLAPGGDLFVFEMSPHPLADRAQSALWGAARRLIGPAFDSYFETTDRLVALGTAALGVSPRTVRTFQNGPFTRFAPSPAVPWLSLPRFLFPFDAVGIHWRTPTP